MHAGANKVLLGEAKAHEPVLVAMRAHVGVVAVQNAACDMLSNMAFNNGEWLCTRVHTSAQDTSNNCSLFGMHVLILCGACRSDRRTAGRGQGARAGDGGHASARWDGRRADGSMSHDEHHGC